MQTLIIGKKAYLSFVILIIFPTIFPIKSTLQNTSFDGLLAQDPVWSPTGNQIAFWSLPGGNIWTINSNGSQLRNLTEDFEGISGVPKWSPDGELIAFNSSQDGTSELWIMKADGLDKVNLSTTIDESVGYVEWSPDGNLIAFTGQDYLGDSRWEDTLYVITIAGSILLSYTPGNESQIDWISWSPDSREIVYDIERSGLSELWLLSVDDGTPRPLLETNTDYSFPEWSPDGTTILALGACEEAGNDLHAIHLESLEIINVTNQSCQAISQPVFWYQDSQSALLQMFFENSTNRSDIVLVDLDGLSLKNLTPEAIGEITNPTLSPIDTSVAFQSDRDGEVDIWALDLESSAIMNLTGQHRR